MRKNLTYFAILAGAAATLTVVSCAPDSQSSAASITDPKVAQQRLQDLQNTYGWIGKYHTDGLAYMYSQLIKGNGRKTHADMCRIAAKAVKEFQREQRHRDIPAGLIDPAITSETCPSDANNVHAVVLSGAGTSTQPRHSLSAAAQNYVDQIVALTNNLTTRSAYVNGILNIETQAAASLPGDEAGAVVGVASVALSSLYYWEVNLDAWVSIPGTIATAYTLSPLDMSAATLKSVGAPLAAPRKGSWWQNPYIRGFGKVLAADGVAAARTVYLAWEVGPIGWDAAAASALWSSGTTTFSLLF